MFSMKKSKINSGFLIRGHFFGPLNYDEFLKISGPEKKPPFSVGGIFSGPIPLRVFFFGPPCINVLIGGKGHIYRKPFLRCRRKQHGGKEENKKLDEMDVG